VIFACWAGLNCEQQHIRTHGQPDMRAGEQAGRKAGRQAGRPPLQEKNPVPLRGWAAMDEAHVEAMLTFRLTCASASKEHGQKEATQES